LPIECGAFGERALCPPLRESAMSKKPVTHWTIDELKKTVVRKFETAKKYQPGPKRQKLLREAKRYQNLLEIKKRVLSYSQPPHL
jgi:hypothetical protein